MSRLVATLFALLTAAVLIVGTPAQAQSPDDESHTLRPNEMAGGEVPVGRKLARQHCARCHVIKSYNPMGGVGNSPSLDRLVTWDDGIWRIATFFDRPPHAAFVRVEGVQPPTDNPPSVHPFKLSAADLEHLVAYARALKVKVESAN